MRSRAESLFYFKSLFVLLAFVYSSVHLGWSQNISVSSDLINNFVGRLKELEEYRKDDGEKLVIMEQVLENLLSYFPQDEDQGERELEEKIKTLTKGMRGEPGSPGQQGSPVIKKIHTQ